MNEQSVDALFARYRATFKDKGDLLTQLNFDTEQNSDAIRAALHKIAGSSGLYGYDELHHLSLAAEHAENCALKDDCQKVIDWLREHS